jgi:hypothetical protein
MKKNFLKNIIMSKSYIIFTLFLFTYLCSTAQVYDMTNRSLDFSSTKQKTVTNQPNKRLYEGVVNINGNSIDCIVTNVGANTGTTTVNTFDVAQVADPNNRNALTSAYEDYFIPNLTTNVNLNTFRFEFIKGGSLNSNGTFIPVILDNLFLNIYDIDGYSGNRNDMAFTSGDFLYYEVFSSGFTSTRDRPNENTFTTSNANGVDFTSNAGRIRLKFGSVSFINIGLGSRISSGNNNSQVANENYYVQFAEGTGSGTITNNNAITCDLNTLTTGANQQLEYSTCNSNVNFTNGNTVSNISATSSALTNLLISYNLADIVSTNNEFLVIGSSSINLSLTSGNGTVTVSNTNYNYSIANNSFGLNTITFTKNNLVLSEAETLLDAIQYKMTSCNVPADSRQFAVNVTLDLTLDIQSPSVFFIANLLQSLPVNVVSFTGKAIATGNQLSWTVAQEDNFNHYEVLRSDNGRDFNTVGTVYSLNNSLEMKSYSFVDTDTKNDLSYYKLRLVDNNGSVAYSSLVVVSRTNIVPTVSNVFPNPASTQLNVELNGVATDNMTVTIQDLTGKIVYQAENVSAQSSVYSFDINALKRGVYIIRIQDEMGNVSVNKFAISK